MKIYDGITVQAQQLLDKRTAVQTKDDLFNINTWPHDGSTIYMAEGICVSVISTGELYMLMDLSQILNRIPYNYDEVEKKNIGGGWKLVVGSGSGSGSLDGGRADEIYTNDQLIDCGGAE